jgi:hypothetical protein
LYTYFGEPWNGNYWHILCPVGIVFDTFVRFMTIWYLSNNVFCFVYPHFGMTGQENLATLTRIVANNGH